MVTNVRPQFVLFFSAITGEEGWLWIFHPELLLFHSPCTPCMLHLRYYKHSITSAPLFFSWITMFDHSCSNSCSCRCLWKDFLKVSKRNTKIKGLLYRYFDSYWDSTSEFENQRKREWVIINIKMNYFFKSWKSRHNCLYSSLRQWLHLGSPLEWQLSKKPTWWCCPQKSLWNTRCSTLKLETKQMAVSVT